MFPLISIVAVPSATGSRYRVSLCPISMFLWIRRTARCSFHCDPIPLYPPNRFPRPRASALAASRSFAGSRQPRSPLGLGERRVPSKFLDRRDGLLAGNESVMRHDGAARKELRVFRRQQLPGHFRVKFRIAQLGQERQHELAFLRFAQVRMRRALRMPAISSRNPAAVPRGTCSRRAPDVSRRCCC